MRTLTRSQAIEALRRRCVELTDDEHSICEVAARLNIFCHGFSRWTFTELKKKYDWIVRRHPHITPKELEDLANRWQLARQFVKDAPLACDVQAEEHYHPMCKGWGEFTEEDLARFHEELLGEAVRVVPDPSESKAESTPPQKGQ